MLEQLPERLSNYRTVPGHGPDGEYVEMDGVL